MAVAFVNKGSAVATVTTTLGLVGPAANLDDIYIASIYTNDNTAVTAPAGWALVYQANNTVTMSYSVFWKRVLPGDSGGTFNFTVAGTTVAFGVILNYRGAFTGNPIGAVTNSPNASSATITFATLTPSRPSSLIIALAGYALTGASAGAIAGSNPTLSSNEADVTATGNGASILEYDGLSNTGAATGARTAASGTTAAVNTGVLVELLSPDIAIGPTGGGGARYTGYQFASRTRSRDGT